jgi:peptide-methionine (S)-S-oxide reductase
MRALNGRMALGIALAMAFFATASAQTEKTASAIFASGCFWCTESDFDKVAGVVATTSGYIGGDAKTATYEQVSAGRSGHKEAVKVVYDPAKVSYRQLLDVFWRNVDPLDANGQFCDKGSQYLGAIFVGNDEERALAEETKAKVAQKLGTPVVTQILPLSAFYPAEEYHQDYHKKNSAQYAFYRWGCRRDQRLEQLWGKP